MPVDGRAARARSVVVAGEEDAGARRHRTSGGCRLRRTRSRAVGEARTDDVGELFGARPSLAGEPLRKAGETRRCRRRPRWRRTRATGVPGSSREPLVHEPGEERGQDFELGDGGGLGRGGFRARRAARRHVFGRHRSPEMRDLPEQGLRLRPHMLAQSIRPGTSAFGPTERSRVGAIRGSVGESGLDTLGPTGESSAAVRLGLAQAVDRVSAGSGPGGPRWCAHHTGGTEPCPSSRRRVPFVVSHVRQPSRGVRSQTRIRRSVRFGRQALSPRRRGFPAPGGRNSGFVAKFSGIPPPNPINGIFRACCLCGRWGSCQRLRPMFGQVRSPFGAARLPPPDGPRPGVSGSAARSRGRHGTRDRRRPWEKAALSRNPVGLPVRDASDAP